MPALFRKKQIRLPSSAYGVSGTVWLVTVGTEDRTPWFDDDAVAVATLDLLEATCRYHGAELLLGCVLPDHVHAVVEVTTGSLVAIVRSWKSMVVRRWWEAGGEGTLWQRSFHDRGLRTPTDIEAAIRYVFDNPTRAGLVEEPGDYPHLRGTVVEGG